MKNVGLRLSQMVRSGSSARLGGDEFTILLTDFDRPDMPALVARKVLAELTRPFQLESRTS